MDQESVIVLLFFSERQGYGGHVCQLYIRYLQLYMTYIDHIDYAIHITGYIKVAYRLFEELKMCG